MAKSYVVAGATGRQGGATARHLRKLGHRVVGITHTPANVPQLAAMGVEPLLVDLRDSDVLAPHLVGVDGFFAVTDPFAKLASSEDVAVWTEDEVRQGRASLRAAERARVPHVVLGSVATAAQERGAPVHRTKLAIEREARELRVPLTILRPPFYMGSWAPGQDALTRRDSFYPKWSAAGRIELPVPPDTPIPHMDPDDIGKVAAWSFAHPELSVGEGWELVGEVTTFPEIARIVSKRWGRPIEFSQVPVTDRDFPLWAPLARREYSWSVRPWEEKFGFRMTSFEEYVRRLPDLPETAPDRRVPPSP